MKRFVSVVLTVAMISILVSAPTLAAAAGSGPDQALAPANEWRAVAPQQSVWYSFEYAGDESQIAVWMNVTPSNSAGFSVWTPDELQQLASGAAVEPIGRGSPNPYGVGDLSWSGSFNLAGTFYVLVENPTAAAAYHALNVAGSGVTIAAAAQEQAPAGKAAAVSAPAPAKAPVQTVTPAGSNPERAFPIPAFSATIAPGASVWHQLAYAGDGSQILLSLDAQGQGGLAFGVWTPEEVRQMQAGVKVDPIGRGSKNPDAIGDLSWSGNFPEAGVYFVKVENGGAAPVGYSMNAQGAGVGNTNKGEVLLIAEEQSADPGYMLTTEVAVMISMLEKAGYKVAVASESGQLLAGGTVSTTLKPDLKLADVNVDDYLGFIIPCMAKKTMDPSPRAVAIIKQAAAQGKPVAAQYGGILTLGAAGVLDGKQFAYVKEGKQVVPGKGIYAGEEVVQDGKIVTSAFCPLMTLLMGKPDETPELTQKFIALLGSAS